MYGYETLLQYLEWWYAIPGPDHRPRNREMKILALGISRSGTECMEALKQALEELGYDRVYHGWDTVLQPTDYVVWREALRGKFEGGKKFTRDDWDRLFGDCQVVSDIPCILFAKELIEAYPEAQVILAKRNIESWHHSVMATILTEVHNYPRRFLQLFHPLTFQYTVFYKCYYLFFTDDFERRGKVLYEEYNAMIKGLVPPEKLLEYHVSEGWGPLCKWLGKEIPEKEMPNGNFGSDFARRVGEVQEGWLGEARWNVVKVFGGLLACVVVISWIIFNVDERSVMSWFAL